MDRLYPVQVKQSNSVFLRSAKRYWFQTTELDKKAVLAAKATDLDYNMLRRNAIIRSGWTVFNQWLSTNQQHVTRVGYMRIPQVPAHECDTLNAVV